MSWLSDAFGGVGSFVQSGIDLLTGSSPRQLANQQYANNRDLAKYQNDLNMQSWMQQQQYNTPAAQMQRFKDAGLNPNLIYGQGNNGNANSPVQLSAGSAKQAAPSIANGALGRVASAASQWLDMKSKMKELEILDSRASIEKSQALVADDNQYRSAVDTFGSDLGSYSAPMRGYTGTVRGMLPDENSPYRRKYEADIGLKNYSTGVKEQEINKRLIDNRLLQTFGEQERQLQLDRDRQSYELEKYTNDPMFYYGEKAVNRMLDFIPKVPRFNSKTKSMSDDQMINHLRGRGHSVRRGVYP